MAAKKISQFSVFETARQGKMTHAGSMTPEARDSDLELLGDRLEAATDLWPLNFHKRISTSGLYFPPHHVATLEAIQVALDKALTNIIGRWWSDSKAAFPKRMPLEEHEERLLRWMDTEGFPLCWPFRDRKGCYRADVLVEAVTGEDGAVEERLRICEINSRMAYNAFIVVPLVTDITGMIPELERAGIKPLSPDYQVRESDSRRRWRMLMGDRARSPR